MVFGVMWMVLGRMVVLGKFSFLLDVALLTGMGLVGMAIFRQTGTDLRDGDGTDKDGFFT